MSNNVVKAKLRIARAIKSTLGQRWVAGKPIVTTDTGELYVGQGDNTDAIKISDIIQVDNLPLFGLKNKIYVKNLTNQLYIWDGTKFNPLTGDGGVSVYNTFQALPSVGVKNMIYIVLSDESFYPTSNKSIYVWDLSISKYVLCSRGISSRSFSSIKVNNVSIGARSKQDQLEIKTGEGLSISGDQSTNTIIIEQTTRPKASIAKIDYHLSNENLVNLPATLTYTTAEVIGDSAYIMGGYNGSIVVNTLYKYNMTSNTVEKFGTIPSARFWSMSCVYNGNIYLFGGKTSTSSAALNDFWKYDVDANNWTQMPSMPVGKYGAFSTVLGTKLWVIGGQNSGYTNTIQYYDFILNQWVLVDGITIPTPRSLGSTFVFDNLIYCVGGRTADNYTSSTVNEVFDTDTLTWSSKAPLPVARWGSGSVTYGGLGYVILGNYTSSNAKTIYAYNPLTDAWLLIANNTTISKACFGTVVYNGKIFMFGGNVAVSTPYYDTCNSYAIISGRAIDFAIINVIKPNNAFILNTTTGESGNSLALVENDIWQFGTFDNIDMSIIITEKQM